MPIAFALSMRNSRLSKRQRTHRWLQHSAFAFQTPSSFASISNMIIRNMTPKDLFERSGSKIRQNSTDLFNKITTGDSKCANSA